MGGNLPRCRVDARGVARARPIAPDDPGFGFPRFEKKSWAGVTVQSRKFFSNAPRGLLPPIPRTLRRVNAPTDAQDRSASRSRRTHEAERRSRRRSCARGSRGKGIAGWQVGCVIGATVLKPRDVVDLDRFGDEPPPDAKDSKNRRQSDSLYFEHRDMHHGLTDFGGRRVGHTLFTPTAVRLYGELEEIA